MNIGKKLRIGDVSDNGQVTIVDEDRLCYLVRSESRGSVGLRTISKTLLDEYIAYFIQHPDANANLARDVLSGKSDIDKFEYGYTSTLTLMAKMTIQGAKNTPVNVGREQNIDKPLQRIYYGAPGTGKSYEITQKTKGSKDVVRTTFHPDSDYSTFVGAYKPTMGKGKVYGAQGPLRDNGKDVEEPKIVYEFVEQAFLQAYILAWEKYAKDHEEKQFLVIEEINRGNCAQIFGDIFQLLDRRKDGFSDYPINPDKDIRLHLKQKLEDLSLTDIPAIDNIDGDDLGAMICNGEKMLLPPNLYIWATMNTSDQSLFPIDSAFKRRWDWKYMPIDTKKECWYIKVGNARYSWTTFLEKVNNELLTDETAEDKHLGFYFCKAENNEIATEKFVGKVLFYLWNDVFKIYGIPSAIGSSKEWGYTKFYNPDGSVDEAKVASLLEKLGLKPEL